tara:strand:+ start:418 stop:657 length:240 start_codon:yes stop_codon:yes gene_type:complete
MKGKYIMTLNLKQLRDVAERSLATFFQAAIGAIGTNSLMDLGVDNWKMIVAAGASSALAVIKGYIATVIPVGDDTASMV